MHEILESIEIKASPEKVFNFLKNLDKRLRLNPSHRLIWIEKLTNGEPSLNSKFKIIIEAGGRRIDYVTEWVEYIENEKIVSVESNGKIKVTITLQKKDYGTFLSYKEEFDIPFETIFLEEFPENEIPLWKKILFFTKYSLSIEYSNKVENIKKRLRNDLKIYLSRIKETIEAET